MVGTVNGTEITVAELNEEARARGLPIGRDPALKAAVVRELAERKLLVAAARDNGLDQDPRYLLAQRRSEEILLAQQLLAASADSGTPSAAELDKYVAANPLAFDQRVVVAVDQVDIAGAARPELRRALASAPTVERMEQLARAAGLSAVRTQGTLDSAGPLDARGGALLRLKAGDNFVLPRPGGLAAGKVVAITPQPVPPEQRRQAASERLQRERTEQALAQWLERLRPTADIRFQSGFDGPEAGQGR